MQPITPAAPAAPAKRRPTRNLPAADQPLAELLTLAAAEWQARPQLTLLWSSPAQAAQLAADFQASIREAGAAHDALSPAVQRLAQLDALIDGAEGKLKYVRKALALQYDEEDDGRAYYGELGIEKTNGTYTLPRDRGRRAEALRKLVAALPKHHLDATKYGTAYWAPIANEYNALQPQAAQATGARSAEVGDKNALRQQAEAVLAALLLVLQANYPQTYKAERRQFGFLKESY